MVLEDQYGRRTAYLRISLTDRCNLSCFYCTPSSRCGRQPGHENLAAGDIIKIIQAAANCGVTKIRLTGGEPLLYTGLEKLIADIRGISGITDLSLTTNATLLAPMAKKLAAAGLQRVNISLDSFRPEVFREITGGGSLAGTLKGIEAALHAGLKPVKINCVLLRGVNDGEIPFFAQKTLQEELDVRFIEFMPITGEAKRWHKFYLPLAAAMDACRTLGPLEEDSAPINGGPARYYRLAGARGKIGFISPFSRHFCHSCNRMRITAKGTLRACLFDHREQDLRPALGSRADLAALLQTAVLMKPDPDNLHHDPLVRCQPDMTGMTGMMSIGG